MGFGSIDVLLVVVLVAAPLKGGRGWGWGIAAWFCGVLTVTVATMGQLGGDPRHTFLAASIQFCLLFFLAPLLLALGSPGPGRNSRLVALSGPILACVVTLAWFLTPWLRFSLGHSIAYQAGHLILLAAGWLFCAPAVRSGDLEASAYPALILLAFLELLLDAIPGILITVRHDLLAPSVFLAHHSAAAAQASQVHGGEVLWVIAEVLDVPFLAALIFHWVRADARHAAVIDARLDAHAPAPDETNPGDLQRPWWETDASVFGRRANAFNPDE